MNKEGGDEKEMEREGKRRKRRKKGGGDVRYEHCDYENHPHRVDEVNENTAAPFG
jgi:hypothetical protein